MGLLDVRDDEARKDGRGCDMQTVARGRRIVGVRSGKEKSSKPILFTLGSAESDVFCPRAQCLAVRYCSRGQSPRLLSSVLLSADSSLRPLSIVRLQRIRRRIGSDTNSPASSRAGDPESSPPLASHASRRVAPRRVRDRHDPILLFRTTDERKTWR